ncbi:M48 family metalloprotease [Desulfovibrio cuneatus]|uniref:M48 family metalloprotease n=1 Tax=Desulfovibrio cuneatus TaxID=159728 RepID=UPI0004808DE6|nr:M48 family metalloprotease [Desulfovibrio cuneatus]
MLKRFALAVCMVGLLCGFQLQVGRALDAGSDAVSAATLTNEDLVKASRDARKKGDQMNNVAPASDKYAQRLAKLTKGLEKEDGLNLNYKVYLVKEPNANAMPDGSIRVHAGLMDMYTDDELLYVIGHEIGHVKGGDGLASMRTALLASAARKGAGAAGGPASALSDSQLGDIFEAVINAQYSQKQEYAADAYAVAFMKRHKADPKAAVTGLNKLAALSGGAGGGIIASHPNPKDRAARIAKELGK